MAVWRIDVPRNPLSPTQSLTPQQQRTNWGWFDGAEVEAEAEKKESRPPATSARKGGKEKWKDERDRNRDRKRERLFSTENRAQTKDSTGQVSRGIRALEERKGFQVGTS
jgi:hypothetical protein